MKRRGFIKAAGISPVILLPGRSAWSQPDAARVFAHGVASGDPLHDRVMLWTRASLPRGSGAVEVSWEVAEDRAFSRIVKRGSAVAAPERDYCVKVDVAGLAPGRAWYYRFKLGESISQVGRTRTLPEGSVQRLAFAIASCSNYPAGYFTAYRDIASQDDLDAVIHLGDYIYEYGAGGYASARAAEFGRTPVPGHDLITLDDYRLRHAQYKSDPDLQAMHAVHPVIAVWDDHEVANDAWRGGAENHQPGQGDWRARRCMAWQAYDEWMPTRTPNLADTGRLYRAFEFGDLVQLVMLDTRFIGRDRQLDAVPLLRDPPALEAARRDPNRDLLGPAQSAWLNRILAQGSDRQRWQLIGQQVLVSELLLPDLSGIIDIDATRQRLGPEIVDVILQIGGRGLPMLWDTWDGYDSARQRFLNELDTQAESAVVLTGDIHASIAGNLALPGRNRNSAVEVVTTSISSPGFEAYLPTIPGQRLEPAMLEFNPALAWMEASRRGWVRLEVEPDTVHAIWRHVARTDQPHGRVDTAVQLSSRHRSSGAMGLGDG